MMSERRHGQNSENAADHDQAERAREEQLTKDEGERRRQSIEEVTGSSSHE